MAPSSNSRLSAVVPPPSDVTITNAETCADQNSWPRRTAERVAQLQWHSTQMEGTAPRLLFLIGFLINSTAMSGLFYLLDQSWLKENGANNCVYFEDTYVYSIRSAFPFFSLVALATFAIICLIQFHRYKIEQNSYFFVTVLGSATFIASAVLLLISSFAILRPKQDCKTTPKLQDLKTRFMFQSIASFFTAAVYLLLGFLLVKRSRSVDSIVPTTPIYQIGPPEFDSLFPPPPTYQQSQIHHHESQRRQAQR